MNNFSKIISNKNIRNNFDELLSTLVLLDKNEINIENVHHLIEIYQSNKNLQIRNKTLKLLYDFSFPELLYFFENTYKRERYLDMKLYALRGLSKFLTETQIEAITTNFSVILAKRQESTLYNYQEYELLKGLNALPFLCTKYGYSCFKNLLNQVNKQYNAMPDAFKGHFTTDKDGNIILLNDCRTTYLISELWHFTALLCIENGQYVKIFKI